MANMTLSEYILEVVLPAFGATFRMLFASTILSIIFGFLLAIALVVTNQQGLHPNKTNYQCNSFFSLHYSYCSAGSFHSVDRRYFHW